MIFLDPLSLIDGFFLYKTACVDKMNLVRYCKRHLAIIIFLVVELEPKIDNKSLIFRHSNILEIQDSSSVLSSIPGKEKVKISGYDSPELKFKL